MAVAINKAIELPPRFGGLTLAYWKLTRFEANLFSSQVHVTMSPFLDSSKDNVTYLPADSFSRTYILTFGQAGLNLSQTGNQIRDRILQFLVDNESDFAGGVLV